MSSKISMLFSDLPGFLARAGIELLDGLYQFEVRDTGSRWSVRHEAGRTEVRSGFEDPACGYLSATAGALASVLTGALDPMSVLGTLEFRYVDGSREPPGSVPVEESGQVRILTFLLQCFNERHLRQQFRNHELGRFYRTGTFRDAAGRRVIAGGWSIPASVGQLLYDLVTNHNLVRTLEIGLAYGISAMFVCQAHKDRESGFHTAVDPWQNTVFRSIGVENIARCGLASHFELITAPDFEALPRLLQQDERFDLAFIDGLHIFDYVLLDFFYADRMLRQGGYVVFDDSNFPGVKAAIAYVRSNRAYELIHSLHDRVAVLRKLDHDSRPELDVSFHKPF